MKPTKPKKDNKLPRAKEGKVREEEYASLKLTKEIFDNCLNQYRELVGRDPSYYETAFSVDTETSMSVYTFGYLSDHFEKNPNSVVELK